MENGNYIWSHTGYMTFSDNSNQIIRKVSVENYKGNIFPLVIISSPIATPSVMIKTKVLKDNIDLRFPVTARYGEDGGLWVKLSIRFPLGVLNEELSRVRIRGTNAALSARIQIKGRSNSYELFIKDNKNIFNKNNSSMSIIFAFKLCKYIDTCLDKMEDLLLNKKIIEVLAGFLYAPIWMFFKYQKHKRIKNMK
jgi:hypothetical protein